MVQACFPVFYSVGKRHRSLGFLRRNFKHCSRQVKSATYTTIVKPVLEYTSLISKLISRLLNKKSAVPRCVINDYTSRILQAALSKFGSRVHVRVKLIYIPFLQKKYVLFKKDVSILFSCRINGIVTSQRNVPFFVFFFFFFFFCCFLFLYI